MKSNSISLQPSDENVDALVSLYVSVESGVRSLSFQLAHCDHLVWTFDDSTQGSVGKGQFTVWVG